jgi:methyl-accepting chemotaxis protein/methyl-accepting chemotaxis protein-3 (ribose and galactose sensor receptor)
MKLLTKLLLIVCGAVTGMALLGGFAVTSLRSTMLQERQQSMQLLVRMATKQVEHFQELEKSGKLSHDDAQTAAKDTLRAMHDGENYIFVRSGDQLLMTLVHPDPRKEGFELKGAALPNGQTVTEVYLQALQNNNAAVVSILTKRPNSNVLEKKISAIQRVQGWGWVIGSGDFVEDIDKAFWHYVIEFLIIGGAVLVGVILLAVAMAHGILRQLGGSRKMLSNRCGRSPMAICQWKSTSEKMMVKV